MCDRDILRKDGLELAKGICLGGLKAVGALAAFLFILIACSCSSRKSVINNRDYSPEISMKSSFSEGGNIKATVASKIVEDACNWIGVPYKYGGNNRQEGVDCSGLVVQVFLNSGVKLPRNSAAQYEFCNKIDSKDVKTGDLVFFATGEEGEKISHVGIVIDKDHFIHSSSRKGVCVSNLNSQYYQKTFKGFGRVIN